MMTASSSQNHGSMRNGKQKNNHQDMEVKDSPVIPIDIYSTEMLLHIGGKDGLKKKLGKYFPNNTVSKVMHGIGRNSVGYTCPIEDKGVYLLWLKEVPDTPFGIGVMSHEVLHLAVNIMKHAGIEPSDSSEEAYAYLVQFLTKSIMSKFISS